MRKIIATTKITDAEYRFIDSYILHMDSTRAAEKAGYSSTNAASVGRELLTKPNIKREVDKRLQNRNAEYKVTEQRIIETLAGIAFMDPLSVYHPDGTAKELEDLPPQVRQAITKVSTRTVGHGRNARQYVQYELASKMQGLEMLGKYLALFTDKVDIKQSQTRNMSDDELTAFINQLTRQTSLGNVIDGEATEISST